MSCPPASPLPLPTTDRYAQGSQTDLSNAMRTTVAGKTVTFDVDTFKARAEGMDFDDVSQFEDWTLYTYRDSRGTPVAFVNFNGNREGSSRSSKRENALNPVIAKFLTQFPRMTPLFPPPPEST